MNTQWFSVIAFVAATLLGYAVISSRDDGTEPLPAPVIMGYYLKEATIVETGIDGGPRMRIAAADVQQDVRDNAVHLQTVKADYLTVATESEIGCRNANGRCRRANRRCGASGRL